jgi:pilus assembly protein CpaF
MAIDEPVGTPELPDIPELPGEDSAEQHRDRLFDRNRQSLDSRLKSASEDVLERRPRAAEAPPGATDFYAELKTRIHHECITKLGPELFRQDVPYSQLQSRVLRVVGDQLSLDGTPLTRDERSRIVREIADDILGYGPLEPLLADHAVTEIMVNGFDSVFIERLGRIEATKVAFADEQHLLRIIDKIVSMVGRRIDESSPMVDARLPDGSRVNAIIPPLALDGPVLTIRKFAGDTLAMDDLIRLGTITQDATDFLGTCVQGKLNILVAGGSGAGKTTLLNNLSTFVPEDERIITIEDAAEIRLHQQHVVRLDARPANIEGQGEIRIRELVRNALRMRPDRIIVGEVRGAETLDMLQAMNTGHEGSLTTIHANSTRDALYRLETLILTAGIDLPLRAIREQISSALDLVIHLTRLVDGSRRVTHVTEIQHMEGEVITLQDIFVARAPDEEFAYSPRTHSLLEPLRSTGLKPQFLEKLAANGAVLPPSFFDGLEEAVAEPATGTRRFTRL